MGLKKDKDGKPIYTDLSFKDGATSSANQNATDVFNFLADNTEVEWGKLSITEKSTESTNITVHSSHGKTSENRSTTIAISTNTEYFTVLDHTHSHPNKIYSHDQPHCPQCSSDADRAFRDKLLIKFPNATTNIRHSKGYERSYKNDTNVNYGK